MNNVGGGRPRINSRAVHPLVLKLRAARLSKRMSQDTLAKITGYSKCIITRWETGRYVPTLYHLSDWCSALGYELVVRDNAKTALAEVIPFPSKQKLMAGR